MAIGALAKHIINLKNSVILCQNFSPVDKFVQVLETFNVKDNALRYLIGLNQSWCDNDHKKIQMLRMFLMCAKCEGNANYKFLIVSERNDLNQFTAVDV